jgi:hypothetical protein
MGPQIDLLGCEYLGGCPSLGAHALNKVELHFDTHGLTIAVAPQGLFSPAAAHTVLTVPWPEITTLSATHQPPSHHPHGPVALARRAANVLRTRLELPNQLTISTATWTMTIGVRVAAAELVNDLRDLLATRDGPVPGLAAG